MVAGSSILFNPLFDLKNSKKVSLTRETLSFGAPPS